MNKALLALLAVGGVAALAFTVGNQDIRVDVLRLVDQRDSEALHSLSPSAFNQQENLAIQAFSAGLDAGIGTADPLAEFAGALGVAGAASNAWANAFIKIGRDDIGRAMADFLVKAN